MEGVDDMGIEEEVISKLEDHEKRICNNSEKISTHDQKINHHEDEITALQIRGASNEQRFNNLDDKIDSINVSLIRIETNGLQGTNLLMSTLSQIAISNSKSNNDIAKSEVKNEAEITKKKMSNNLAIGLKILTVISAVILGWFSAKYGVSLK